MYWKSPRKIDRKFWVYSTQIYFTIQPIVPICNLVIFCGPEVLFRVVRVFNRS